MGHSVDSEPDRTAVAPCSGCVSLGKLLSLSVPPLPPLYNRKYHYSTYLVCSS